MMSFKVGERVRVYFPDDRYHDMPGKVIEIDEKDDRGLIYRVQMDSKTISKKIPLWLPEYRLRTYRVKTLNDLEFGDTLVNPHGMEFEVIEPPTKIFFLQSKSTDANIIQYLTVEDLQNNQFSIKSKEPGDAGSDTHPQMATV